MSQTTAEKICSILESFISECLFYSGDSNSPDAVSQNENIFSISKKDFKMLKKQLGNSFIQPNLIHVNVWAYIVDTFKSGKELGLESDSYYNDPDSCFLYDACSNSDQLNLKRLFNGKRL